MEPANLKATKYVYVYAVSVVALPRVSVSVEESGAEKEVNIGREGADLGLHLTSIPHSWPILVVFVPGIQHFVGILTNEGV